MFNLFKTRSVRTTKVPNDFENSSCKCIQQDMIMNTEWMDTSRYRKVKALLKCQNAETRRINLLRNPQRDLFE